MTRQLGPGAAAVVTGASRGIGRAVALELAARGFAVTATVRDMSVRGELLRDAAELAGSLRVEHVDVTAADGFRLPDDLAILVNNAAVRRAYLPIEETALDEWRQVFEVNVFAPLEWARRALPILRRNGGGVICNVTSAAILGPKPFFGTYSGSKAALSAATEVLALEAAPFGIRVVEILPGPIDTEMFRTSVSRRPPEAIEYEPYRPMAERWSPGIDFQPTSSEVAAAQIADAIVSADGPWRVGCDPVSAALLEQWRSSTDLERMTEAHRQFGVQD